MPERNISLHIGNGSTLEYSANGTSYTRLYGLLNIPEIGGTPNTVDTSSLDNTEYETAMYGLKPAQAYAFEFNMEDPETTANINVVVGLVTAGTSQYWKITYANGVKVTFKSVAKYSIQATQNGELLKFSLFLAPEGEPTVALS